jgi:outer membrane immunogenic protein
MADWEKQNRGWIMTKVLLATTLLAGVLSAGAAQAADMPLKAQRAAPYVFSWTGCYIGGNVGGAWAHQHAHSVAPPALLQAPGNVNIEGSSVIGGGQLGCNYQFASNWVIGIEGDIEGTGIKDTVSFPNLFPNGAPVGSGIITFSHDVKWVASLRGRLGFTPWSNTLLYFTGGGAWAKTDYVGFDAFLGGCPNCGTTAFSTTKSGWVVGGGLEWAWTPNWILGVEYLHYEIDGAASTAFFQSAPAVTAAVFTFDRLKIDSVRARLSYKFY